MPLREGTPRFTEWFEAWHKLITYLDITADLIIDQI